MSEAQLEFNKLANQVLEESGKTHGNAIPRTRIIELTQLIDRIGIAYFEPVSESKRKILSLTIQKFLDRNLDLGSEELLEYLKLLKSLGRVKEDCQELLKQENILKVLNLANAHILTSKESKDSSQNIVSELLTIFANGIMFDPEIRRIFLENDGFNIICKALKSYKPSTRIGFLCGRILFLITYSGEGIACAIETDKVQLYLSESIGVLLKESDDKSNNKESQFTSSMAIREMLKALYNLCLYYGRLSQDGKSDSDKSLFFGETLTCSQLVHFEGVLDTLMEVLSGKYIRHIEDSALLIQVVQVLFLFPVQSPSNVKDTWFPKGNVMKNVDVVFALLEQRVREYTSQNTAASGLFGKGIADEERAKDIPLICILGRCVAANDDVRQDVYHRLFSDRDYHELPEKGDSVRATITKIIGSPVQNDYSQLLGDLVLAVCNSDINSFVKNIGFGNASGYLNSRKLSFDPNSVSSSTLFVKAASTSEQTISNVNDFDVVTGAIQDNADIEKELAAMTEEEKEREAEKLFVLFEKLNKTGIIRTQFDFRNP